MVDSGELGHFRSRARMQARAHTPILSPENVERPERVRRKKDFEVLCNKSHGSGAKWFKDEC